MSQSCEPKEARIFHFEECMDTAACEQMENELRVTLDQVDTHVVFDFTGVKFVSSALLGFCVRAYQKTTAHGFEIINVEPTIKRVFKISGLDAMLNVS